MDNDRTTPVSDLIRLIGRLDKRYGQAFRAVSAVVRKVPGIGLEGTVIVAGALLDLAPDASPEDIGAVFARIKALSSADNDPAHELLDRRCSDFELSVRAGNCLQNANIIYIGELVQWNANDLLRISGFGRKPLKEIKNLVAEMNLALGMDVGDWKRPDQR